MRSKKNSSLSPPSSTYFCINGNRAINQPWPWRMTMKGGEEGGWPTTSSWGAIVFWYIGICPLHFPWWRRWRCLGTYFSLRNRKEQKITEKKEDKSRKKNRWTVKIEKVVCMNENLGEKEKGQRRWPFTFTSAAIRGVPSSSRTLTKRHAKRNLFTCGPGNRGKWTGIYVSEHSNGKKP